MHITGLRSHLLLIAMALCLVACSKGSSSGSGSSASTSTSSQDEVKTETKMTLEKSNKALVGPQEITMYPGQIRGEVAITSSQDAGTFSSSFIAVSCDYNLPALNSNVNSLILLPGSKVVIFRDQNYRFPDGSLPESTEPTVVISCEGEPTEEIVESSSTQVKRLNRERLMMEVLVLTATDFPKQSAPLFYTCHSSLDNALNSVYNGFNLLPGSRTVVNRDTKYIFNDGSSAARKPKVVISCQ